MHKQDVLGDFILLLEGNSLMIKREMIPLLTIGAALSTNKIVNDEVLVDTNSNYRGSSIPNTKRTQKNKNNKNRKRNKLARMSRKRNRK